MQKISVLLATGNMYLCVYVGPENVPSECELALALSLLGSKPGSTSQRFSMLSAVRRAWPDDPVGVLGCMMLEDVVLAPGEAVMIPAGCPHAYVCGGWARCGCGTLGLPGPLQGQLRHVVHAE